MADPDRDTPPEVLDSKRDATRYQVLVEIAARQPAVSQHEIAETIGVTSQAVSDYVRDLVEHDYVDKRGRGRYEVTKEGVDWLISRTDSLEAYLERVTSDVLGSVEVDAAVALDPVEEGTEVGLVMRDGVLHADPDGGAARAVAITSGDRGEAVGVTDFEGVVDYETGYITVVRVPQVTDRTAVDPDRLAEWHAAGGLVATAGTEAYALVTRADIKPDIRFGTIEGVTEAAVRGVDILLVVGPDQLSPHTAKFREANVPHEVLDASDL
ncbi:MarR family transcriptional regulator [Halorubrum laminariae]|uniref:MarR family transcriptional regulator n=1 Tax=Halorubrum laminariae TaxID=1433523 RepID=A0ABD6C0C5_9EURY|nr:MarR family transcriptional regulator [Halorubrum laminariae]